MQFKLSFEAAGFTNDRALLECEFSQNEAQGFTEASLAEGTFPAGVLAVIGGHITEDDGQGKSDIRVFVRIDLLVEASSEVDAKNMAPDEDLLTRIADLIAVDYDLDLDAHEWAVTDVAEPEESLLSHQQCDLEVAKPYVQFRDANSGHIASLAAQIGELPSDTHWDLISDMKGVLGTSAANASTDDEDDQETAISKAEEWVTDNCSGKGVEEDVAMALWLRGLVDGEAFLRCQAT